RPQPCPARRIQKLAWRLRKMPRGLRRGFVVSGTALAVGEGIITSLKRQRGDLFVVQLLDYTLSMLNNCRERPPWRSVRWQNIFNRDLQQRHGNSSLRNPTRQRGESAHE